MKPTDVRSGRFKCAALIHTKNAGAMHLDLYYPLFISFYMSIAANFIQFPCLQEKIDTMVGALKEEQALEVNCAFFIEIPTTSYDKISIALG